MFKVYIKIIYYSILYYNKSIANYFLVERKKFKFIIFKYQNISFTKEEISHQLYKIDYREINFYLQVISKRYLTVLESNYFLKQFYSLIFKL